MDNVATLVEASVRPLRDDIAEIKEAVRPLGDLRTAMATLAQSVEHLAASLSAQREEMRTRFDKHEREETERFTRYGERLGAIETENAERRGGLKAVGIIWGAVGAALIASLSGFFVWSHNQTSDIRERLAVIESHSEGKK